MALSELAWRARSHLEVSLVESCGCFWIIYLLDNYIKNWLGLRPIQNRTFHQLFGVHSQTIANKRSILYDALYDALYYLAKLWWTISPLAQLFTKHAEHQQFYFCNRATMVSLAATKVGANMLCTGGVHSIVRQNAECTIFVRRYKRQRRHFSSTVLA